MANKKTNKHIKVNKNINKPQPNKKQQIKTVKKGIPAKNNKQNFKPKKTVQTKKVSINSIPKPITYTEEVKAYKIGKFAVKKEYVLTVVGIVVLVLLWLAF